MKGEIFRRMSMEIYKDERIEREIPAKNDVKKEKAEDEDDYLVNTIGAFGLWQGVVSATVLFTRVVAIWNMNSICFLTPPVEFICTEFSDNVTTEVKNSTCYDNCLKYNYSSVIKRSIVEDFGLICDNAWMASFTQTILMMGTLVGVSLFGWVSDRFGRRAGLLLSTFLNAVFMIALPFSPTYIIFTCVRFVIGVASGGSLMICLVLIMEIIGKRQRDIAGACTLIPDCIAQLTLAGFAYFNSNWQGYTLSYGIATCFIFILILFVPESPRWLVAKGKVDEAVKVVTRAANRNKLDSTNIKDELTRVSENMKLKDREIIKTSYLDFFKSKASCILIVSVFVFWFTLGICFYGIFQYVTIIGVDIYLTAVILGLITILIFPVAIIVNQRLGRKISSIGTTISMAISMLILIFVPTGYWITTCIGGLAFLFSNISFTIVYVHILELYPTPLRNMSYGLASGGAKIGATFAPFVANLSPRWLPSLVFCIVAILSALCCLLLPETKGQNLKDTME